MIFKNPSYKVSISKININSSSDKEIVEIWLTLNSISEWHISGVEAKDNLIWT